MKRLLSVTETCVSLEAHRNEQTGKLTYEGCAGTSVAGRGSPSLHVSPALTQEESSYHF